METRIEATDRWRREGRSEEVQAFRVKARQTCQRAGMSQEEAGVVAWREAMSKFPPLPESEESAEVLVEPRAVRGQVSGLGRIPESWGELGATSTLTKDLEWVNANRLWIVRETGSGGFVVELERASEAAPSRSALSWLELSIKNPSKFMDLVAKKLGEDGGVDDEEFVRAERMSIAEIEGIFARHEELRVHASSVPS
jgi:hypothetical protein